MQPSSLCQLGTACNQPFGTTACNLESQYYEPKTLRLKSGGVAPVNTCVAIKPVKYAAHKLTTSRQSAVR
jgi:hypothetical protein